MADGAVHIDTTAYTLDEVIDLVVGLVDPGCAYGRSHLELPRTDQIKPPATFRIHPAAPDRTDGHPPPLQGACSTTRSGSRCRDRWSLPPTT